MGFRSGAYATVWSASSGKGNYADVRLSISKKNKNTGNYEEDFSGFVRFVGNAKDAALELKERDRIKIGECDVSSRYDKEKKTTYTTFAVFTFEKLGDNRTQSSTPKKVSDDFVYSNSSEVEEEFPFS